MICQDRLGTNTRRTYIFLTTRVWLCFFQ
jgi:hypothetical protein